MSPSAWLPSVLTQAATLPDVEEDIIGLNIVMGHPAAVVERKCLSELRNNGGSDGFWHGRVAAEVDPVEQVWAGAEVHYHVGPRLVLIHRVHLHHARAARVGKPSQLGLELPVEVVGELQPVDVLDSEGLAGGVRRAAVDDTEAATTLSPPASSPLTFKPSSSSLPTTPPTLPMATIATPMLTDKIELSRM